MMKELLTFLQPSNNPDDCNTGKEREHGHFILSICFSSLVLEMQVDIHI